MLDIEDRAVPAIRVAAMDPDVLVTEVALVRERYRLVMEYEVFKTRTFHDVVSTYVENACRTANGTAQTHPSTPIGGCSFECRSVTLARPRSSFGDRPVRLFTAAATTAAWGRLAVAAVLLP